MLHEEQITKIRNPEIKKSKKNAGHSFL